MPLPPQVGVWLPVHALSPTDALKPLQSVSPARVPGHVARRDRHMRYFARRVGAFHSFASVIPFAPLVALATAALAHHGSTAHRLRRLAPRMAICRFMVDPAV